MDSKIGCFLDSLARYPVLSGSFRISATVRSRLLRDFDRSVLNPWMHGRDFSSLVEFNVALCMILESNLRGHLSLLKPFSR